MMSHPIPNMMGSSMEKIKEMVDVNTVIGDPIHVNDGVTIIPVSKVKVGYAGGGSEFAAKNYPTNKNNPFGGGCGAGVTITPMAFLVIKGDSVRMMPVAAPANTTADRVVELVPDVLDKISNFVDSHTEKKSV